LVTHGGPTKKRRDTRFRKKGLEKGKEQRANPFLHGQTPLRGKRREKTLARGREGKLTRSGREGDWASLLGTKKFLEDGGAKSDKEIQSKLRERL